jgi:hypothetical protein
MTDQMKVGWERYVGKSENQAYYGKNPQESKPEHGKSGKENNTSPDY